MAVKGGTKVRRRRQETSEGININVKADNRKSGGSVERKRYSMSKSSSSPSNHDSEGISQLT